MTKDDEILFGHLPHMGATAASRMLSRIPEEKGPLSGPSFWKNANDPIFADGPTYIGTGCDILDDFDIDAVSLAGSNFSQWAHNHGGSEWHTSDCSNIDPGGREFKTYSHCEKLGFIGDCISDGSTVICGSPEVWLKVSTSTAFDPVFGRPYSAEGGLQNTDVEPPPIIAGINADYSTWWYPTSADIVEENGELVCKGVVSELGFYAFDPSVGKKVLCFQDDIIWGPYPAKFFYGIAVRKKFKPTSITDKPYEAFPLYWHLAGGAPTGWSSGILNWFGTIIPKNVKFDVMIYANIIGVKIPMKSLTICESLPWHYSKTDQELKLPDRLYNNTEFTITARIIADVDESQV